MSSTSIKQNYSLLKHNTFGLEVSTSHFFAFGSKQELIDTLPEINTINEAIFMLGEGSNLLFINNFKGIILHSEIAGYEITAENDENVDVRVGGGVIWDDFVEWAVERGYGGAENLSTIPGTIGASPVQNIGAYGVEAKDLISKVEAIELATGKERIFNNTECQFAYRDSIFKNELKGKYAVTYVTFRLDKNPTFNLSYGNIQALLGERPPSLKLIRQVINEVRNSKLPDHKKLGNAGSFFTNPLIPREQYETLKVKHPDMPHYPINEQEVKVPAGWLIDQAGLKGFQHNNAAVHKDQALVLVNTGKATGKDILELSQIVIEKVNEKFGITLTPEVNIL